MKTVKKVIMAIICIPIALILLMTAFETVGMIVNHAATRQQTRNLQNVIEKELTNAEIIDTDSETGNTSGTGNHVDMLSVVVFQTDDSIADIEDKLRNFYEWNEWTCWVEKVDTIAESPQGGYDQFCDKMDIPKQSDNCYLLYLNESAPFADNIEGH